MWAESLREPALAEFVAATYRQVRSRFVEWARRAQAAGVVPAGADPGQVGAVLFGIVPGYMLQRLLVGGVDPGVYREGLRAFLAAGQPA